MCNVKSGQRKVPLLIHIAPIHLVALNYTCRFCANCDLLVAHKAEVEHLLHDLLMHVDPAAIGNDYMVLGTVEKGAWREGLTRPKSPAEIFPHVHDFKRQYSELRLTQGGWYPRDKEPPIMEPPESQEWVMPDRQAP